MKVLGMSRLSKRRKHHLLFLVLCSVLVVFRFFRKPMTTKTITNTRVAQDIQYKASWRNIIQQDKEWKPQLSERVANVVWSQRGIYADDYKKRHAAHEDFKNVVLVMAANYAYLDFYRNWACHARRHGLKWVLVAMDKSIYNAVASQNDKNQVVILSNSAAYFNLSKAARFRQKKFNILSCSKLHMVYKIVSHLGLDLVFSDPDNVFLKDPFEQGASLGDSIRSGNYEYIYQPNNKHYPLPNWKQRDAPPREGNTGFYYVSGSKKRIGIKSLFRSALEECRNNPDVDNQTSFWNAFRLVRDGTMAEKWQNNTDSVLSSFGMPFHNMHFCPNHVIENKETLSYCPMNPFQHPTGYPISRSDMSRVMSYHANYVVGKTKKLQKMRAVGAWSWENETCTIPT